MVADSGATLGYGTVLPHGQFPMFWEYIKCHSRIRHHFATWAVPNVLTEHQVPLQAMAPCCHMSSSQCSDRTSSATPGYGTMLPHEQFPMFWQNIKCHSRIWHRVATWAVPNVLTEHQVPLQAMAPCCHMSSSQMFWQNIKCHSRLWHCVATWAVPNVLTEHQVPLQIMAPCYHMSSSQCSDRTSSATLGYGTALPREQFPMFWQNIKCHSRLWHRVATWAVPNVLTEHQVPL